MENNLVLYLICFIPPMLLALYAQGLVKSRYAAAKKRPAPMTGAEAARIILDSAGLQSVPIEMIRGGGALEDYYSPGERKICLSPEIYNGRSLADVGIAAHEAGHAIQHAQRYLFLGMTQLAFPLVRFGSGAAFYLLLAGMFLNLFNLVLIAVFLFGATAVYQIINLPVEYNASHRAKVQLAKLGIVNQTDMVDVRKVLGAAALTYVAAMIAAFLQFLYFAIQAFGGNRD